MKGFRSLPRGLVEGASETRRGLHSALAANQLCIRLSAGFRNEKTANGKGQNAMWEPNSNPHPRICIDEIFGFTSSILLFLFHAWPIDWPASN